MNKIEKIYNTRIEIFFNGKDESYVYYEDLTIHEINTITDLLEHLPIVADYKILY